MDNTALFTAALQLDYPWKVTKVEFLMDDGNSKPTELHITIGFERGAKFVFYNEDGTVWADADGKPYETTAHDTVERTWQHLNFFQYKTFIHAKLPRVKDGEGHCPTVQPPWARKGSGFTLLFEALIMELARHLPVAVIADLVGVTDKRLWRFIRHYVDEARGLKDYSDVSGIGMDETSRKGHNYITVMADLDKRTVLYVTEGKDHSTVDRFVADFKAHGGDPDSVRVVTCDMSLGFRKGITDNFRNSETVIDKFHVIKHANEAVDEVRKAESKVNDILSGTKYIWLKNSDSLTEGQTSKLSELLKASRHLKTGRAYSMRVALQDIYEQCKTRSEAEERMGRLCSWMMRSRLEPMKKLCRMIRDHWDEVLNYFEYRVTNSILEGINSIIQNIKRRARGFKNVEYFTTMIYLGCSDLDIDAVIAKA